MKKSTRIWLWVALVICAATTILNAVSGRWPSVVIACVAIAGLLLLQLRNKKAGFYLMCFCYAISCVVGIYEGISGGTGLLVSVLMSVIGAAVIPVVTAIFLRGQWTALD